MSEKISISREELTSTAVDHKLQTQALAARAGNDLATPPAASLAARLLYNALVYMTVAGAAAGFIAWASCETIDAAIPDYDAEFSRFRLTHEQIKVAATTGLISFDNAQARSAELFYRYRHNPYVALALSDGLTEEEYNVRFQELDHRSHYHGFIQKLCWFTCAGILFAATLASVEHFVSRNLHAALIAASSGAVVGLVAGVAVSLSINWLYHTIQGESVPGAPLPMWRQMLARSIAWGVFGGFLAMAPGVATGSTKRTMLGFAGGLAGGLIGGLLFDPISVITHSGVLSRMVGLTAIGMLAGLCSGLFEKVARTGWLQVKAGLIAGKQFILYRNPTILGSSPQCEVFLFKDPCIAPRHAAIAQTTAGFHIEEVQPHTGVYVNGQRVKRASLRNGDEIQTGGAVFTFHQRAMD